MKKSLFFIFLVVILSISSAHAQKQGFGLRAGVNTTNVDNSIVIGPHFGMYYSILITEHFGLQPELLYSVQTSNFPIDNIATNRTMTYFNLPIMAKFYVASGFNIQVGPYVGILTRVRSDDDADVSVKADYRGSDFGVAAGIAYELPAGFNLGARYNLGLTDISPDAVDRHGTVVSVDADFTHQFMQFFIGYTF